MSSIMRRRRGDLTTPLLGSELLL
jgi:hypothetical protein